MKLALSLVTIAGLAAVSIAEPPKDAPKTAPTTTKTTTTAGTPATTTAPTAEEMWAEMAKTGPEHKELGKLIGDWDMSIKSPDHTDPSKTTTSKGSEKVEWLLEGRYTKSTTNADFGGMPFTGFGINGYNTTTKKFETTWVDTMGTGQMMYSGSMDANNVLTMTCQYDDPMTNTKKTSKFVAAWTDANTRTFKMYEVDGSNDMLVMDATYTRKGTTTGAAKPLTETVKSTVDAVKKSLPTK